MLASCLRVEVLTTFYCWCIRRRVGNTTLISVKSAILTVGQSLGSITRASTSSVVVVADGALPADNLLVPFNYNRSDGFESPFGTIQGTRVSNTDGCTTPDAYAGEAHDPMSQKSFTCHRGFSNPAAYPGRSMVSLASALRIALKVSRDPADTRGKGEVGWTHA